MADIEKVIKGLECCNAPNNHDDCPYNGENHYNVCTHKLLRDALQLLKEQQERMKSAVWRGWTKSYYKGRDDDDEPIWGKCTYYICSNCGRRTVVADPFCPSCGASMEKEM